MDNVFTDRDMRNQLAATLAEGESDGIDAEAVLAELQATYGTVNLDTIDDEEFWAVVAKHDRTGT